MIKKFIYKNFIFFIIFNIFFIKNLFSAFEYKNISANSAGLAGIKTIIDEEALSVFYNPSLIPNKKSINTFYTKILNIDEFKFSAVAINFDFLYGKFALGYSSFGERDFYIEQSLNMGYKFFIKSVNFGITLKSLLLDLGEMEQKTDIFAIDFGAKINYSEKLTMGMLFSNLNRPKIGKCEKEEIYSDFNFGLRYNILKNIDLLYELIKENNYKIDFKLGSQIEIFEKYILRFGTQKNIETFNFGFGIKNFVDYAYTYHFNLGSQHLFTLKIYF